MLKWKNNIIDKSETKEEVGNVEQKQEEKQEEAPEKVEVSPVEIEICGVFFATLQNISYLYGINPTKTEEMAEEWIGLVKKEDKE